MIIVADVESTDYGCWSHTLKKLARLGKNRIRTSPLTMECFQNRLYTFPKCLENHLDVQLCLSSVKQSRVQTRTRTPKTESELELFGPNSEWKFRFGACLHPKYIEKNLLKLFSKTVVIHKQKNMKYILYDLVNALQVLFRYNKLVFAIVLQILPAIDDSLIRFFFEKINLIKKKNFQIIHPMIYQLNQVHHQDFHQHIYHTYELITVFEIS